MSYIDCINHEYIGDFAGIAMYHPTESITNRDRSAGEFDCHPHELVLGGGWLEHPGMVIRRPDAVVAHFLSSWIDATDAKEFNESEIGKANELISNVLYGLPKEKIFDFCNWSIRNYSDFYSACKSSAMSSPFVEDQRINVFESWLASCFGELVFFSFPELIESTIPDIYSLFQGRVWPLYRNITISVNLYDQVWGRMSVSGGEPKPHHAFKLVRNRENA